MDPDDDLADDPFEDQRLPRAATDLLGYLRPFDDAARASLCRKLLRHGDKLGLTGEPPATLDLATGPEHALLCMALDATDAAYLVLVPEAELDDPMRDALATLSGRVFAGGADLAQPQWDAAVRVLACTGDEFATVEPLVTWAADDGSTVAADELARRWRSWTTTEVATWADLAVRITRVCAYCRAE